MSVFTLHKTDGNARLGTLHTAHGDVQTPAFMPVATQGSVKTIDPNDLRSMGANIVLGNTYHLYLRPGVETVQKFGGLASFMAWNGPTLTDSGGFQGFSLEHLRKISEEGIEFKSHIDGSPHMFSPESVIRHQEGIGADIIMPIDICAPGGSDREAVAAALEMTTRWAERCRAAQTRGDQSLFGIVQGGTFADLREMSAGQITAIDFPGYALGGLSVGEGKVDMYGTVEFTTPLLPSHKPRYLMGVGSPEDLVECVARGIDMFDCVLPTRIARNGALFVRDGRLNIDAARFKHQESPIEDGCDCYTCQTFTAAYINHLFRSKELLAYRLATIHNLRFILRLMEEMRAAIDNGTFESYRKKFQDRFVPPDEKTRHEQKVKWTDAQRRRPETVPGLRTDS
jgi:queuine tRNA-ribosyltransferase